MPAFHPRFAELPQEIAVFPLSGALLQVPNTLFFQKSLRRWRAGTPAAVPTTLPS